MTRNASLVRNVHLDSSRLKFAIPKMVKIQSAQHVEHARVMNTSSLIVTVQLQRCASRVRQAAQVALGPVQPASCARLALFWMEVLVSPHAMQGSLLLLFLGAQCANCAMLHVQLAMVQAVVIALHAQAKMHTGSISAARVLTCATTAAK